MHDSTSTIHATAVIHPATRIGAGVIIGPYAVIEDGVEVAEGSVIGAHAVIHSGCSLGRACQIAPHAVLGGLPQDTHFDPKTPSGVRLGDGVVIREGVTVSRATREGTFTEIGDGAFLMANAHVAHDCTVGEHAILANGALLAGHVHLGAYVFVGGGAAFHQFVRIGEGAMISGLSRVAHDVPPFCMVAERSELIGLNLVGMRRRGFLREVIKEVKFAYTAVFSKPGNRVTLAEAALGAQPWMSREARAFLEFFTSSRRGYAQPRRQMAADDDTDEA